VGVIYSIWPWRAYCFIGPGEEENVIVRWMRREEVPVSERQSLWNRLALLEEVGPDALPGLIAPLKGDFHVMSIRTNGSSPALRPILCFGPFSEQEITLLMGAPIEYGILGPTDVLPVARHNLEVLKKGKRERRVRYEKRSI
jgi:hypothetical protein